MDIFGGGSMNLFRVTGDMTHLVAILLLIIFMWRTKSSEGISGKSQILYALVFTFRYADIFTFYYSSYNSTMKVAFIFLTFFTMLSIYWKFRNTSNQEKDSFRAEILVISTFGLAFFANYEFSKFEVSWAFSEYLEAVAMVPQIYMTWKHSLHSPCVFYYILLLTVYKLMYILNWIYKCEFLSMYYDTISVMSGCSQTLILFIGLWLIRSARWKTIKKALLPKLNIHLVPPGRGLPVKQCDINDIPEQKVVPTQGVSVSDFVDSMEEKLTPLRMTSPPETDQLLDSNDKTPLCSPDK